MACPSCRPCSGPSSRTVASSAARISGRGVGRSDEPKVTRELARDLGLTSSEFDLVVERLGREPSYPEVGLFSALWSEHCAYKHSRVFLKRLPQTGPGVLQGPGENAGALDIGDGWAVVFKIESHNHPSFIEPFQGAATGVGGILRDIFTMGARPIALLDSLRFGDPRDARTRHLVHGVVSGISWYGNCFGCPTVGGEIAFGPEYDGNPLVNVMCVGLVRADRLFPRPWPRRRSTSTRRSVGRRCRSAIRSPRSCCWKRASRRCRAAQSSASRTWVRRAWPAVRPRCPRGAAPASTWSSPGCHDVSWR
ncbi:MAG: hypothetical protein DMD81_17205 [Candidatus Rokuibacteriota bacterium]|nr:MAG: hypothetical protein DMD81_17205 [Candidatus Rokubacteria bacterium]